MPEPRETVNCQAANWYEYAEPFTPAPPPPDPVLGPAEIATIIAEYEASDASRAACERRHAAVTRALALALARSGPQVAGIWRYSGLVSPGLPGAVLRRPVGTPPDEVHAAHAATAIVEEDDTDVD